jgi:uncharacterized membrane protein
MKTAWTDERLDVTLGYLLRAGVILAAGVVSIGGVVFLLRHGQSNPDYHAFRSEPPSFRLVSGILRGVGGFSGRAIIQLGLLILIATPVARVAFSIYVFLRERDRLYVAATLLVFLLLLYSLFFARV